MHSWPEQDACTVPAIGVGIIRPYGFCVKRLNKRCVDAGFMFPDVLVGRGRNIADKGLSLARKLILNRHRKSRVQLNQTLGHVITSTSSSFQCKNVLNI
jgi:hypothetical protein